MLAYSMSEMMERPEYPDRHGEPAVRLACVFPRRGAPSAVGLVRQSQWWPVAQTMTTTLPWVCPSPM
jgi:hypothetical protein